MKKRSALQLIQELRQCFKEQYGVDVKIDIWNHEVQGSVKEISELIHNDLKGEYIYWPGSNMATNYSIEHGYTVVISGEVSAEVVP